MILNLESYFFLIQSILDSVSFIKSHLPLRQYAFISISKVCNSPKNDQVMTMVQANVLLKLW